MVSHRRLVKVAYFGLSYLQNDVLILIFDDSFCVQFFLHFLMLYVSIRGACGPVVQLVRTPACHAGGRRFESVLGRQYAAVAQLVEHLIGNEEAHGFNSRQQLQYESSQL